MCEYGLSGKNDGTYSEWGVRVRFVVMLRVTLPQSASLTASSTEGAEGGESVSLPATTGTANQCNLKNR
ncbi:hypothetical protein F7D09_1121 [Bifidobacterium leontopitheci]|uniref:Uncharacterized protein n=1 Tax=Bifidobacterium leontopitheci TaxID=2650774 RepID=A0A6I1GFN9_9BIFI|nr:hypothetical protein F7D09_1121 [Bifidobacterium leontopitheci]